MPPLVVVGPELAERTAVLAEALSDRRGTAVEVRAAERGDKRRLRELAERNARLALAQDKLRRERRRRERTEALAELAEALGMEEVPIRIEGYDYISNLGPSTRSPRWSSSRAAHRRNRTIGASRSADRRRLSDFASMNEVLSRRLARYLDESGRSPRRRRARRQLRRSAGVDHDRRRQGPARRRGVDVVIESTGLFTARAEGGRAPRRGRQEGHHQRPSDRSGRDRGARRQLRRLRPRETTTSSRTPRARRTVWRRSPR